MTSPRRSDQNVHTSRRQKLAARPTRECAIVDMSDGRAALLIRLMLQNGGRLSNSKRDRYDELTEAEIATMEQAVQRALATPPDV
ncbi:hypothetical protein [Sphingobium tyrosinilyticum]